MSKITWSRATDWEGDIPRVFSQGILFWEILSFWRYQGFFLNPEVISVWKSVKTCLFFAGMELIGVKKRREK